MDAFEKELHDAADEAIFGLQLDHDAAVRFVRNNVDNTEDYQAEAAVNRLLTGTSPL